VIPGQRGPDRTPGELYLDPDVPDRDRVRVTVGDWQAVATHVWTGTGWSRLSAAPVREVPAVAAGVTGWPA
jgi:hypothetical protein